MAWHGACDIAGHEATERTWDLPGAKRRKLRSEPEEKDNG